jgi:uncharacterized protein Usg
MMQGDFERMLRGGSLLTAEILYYRPDHPSLLQSFSWQTIDEAPRFPRLTAFLDHWRSEVEAMIHSIRVAHADWVGPVDFRSIDRVIQIH